MIFLLRTHAGFMILALCIMITGATIARFMKKKPWWLKSHRSLGITGAIFILTGFFAIALQITLTERAHFRVGHSWVGLGALLFALLTPTLGFLQFKVKNMATKLRGLHRWSGRITICLMLINVVLGLLLIGVL
jgi:Eukaryotic cytochrome b561